MKLIEYPDQDMMMIDVANQLAGELNEALMIHDAASFAVPGGSTPGPMFDVLCAADIEWHNVTVLLTDERWVPEDHEHSNARLIRERLLVNRAAAADLMPVYSEGADPDDCIGPLSLGLQPHLPLSVLVLGMGADMHTASLFPGAEGLAQGLHDLAPGYFPIRQNGSGPVNWRMTLTAPVLNGAMSKHLVITGAQKRDALERAQKIDDPMQAPVAAILPGTTVHWAE